MDNKSHTLDENNVLSEEQQKEFDKLLQEYEEKEDSLNKAYNDEGIIGNTINNKKVMFGALGLCGVACFIGMVLSFNKVSTEEDLNMQALTEAQQAQSVDQQNNLRQEAQNLEMAQSDAFKAQQQQELEAIKSNFKPFVDENGMPIYNENSTSQIASSNSIVTPVPTVTTATDTQNNQPNNVIYPQEQTPAPVPPVDPVPNNSYNTNNYNNTDFNNTQGQGAWMELKGIAQGKNGKVAYITNGNTTGTYGIGDTVGNYVVKDIDSTTVTVIEKKTGYPLYLNK